MITTISLVNIHHLTITNFLLVMTTLNNCLRKSQIYNTVLLTIVSMPVIISPKLNYLITGSLYI